MFRVRVTSWVPDRIEMPKHQVINDDECPKKSLCAEERAEGRRTMDDQGRWKRGGAETDIAHGHDQRKRCKRR